MMKNTTFALGLLLALIGATAATAADNRTLRQFGGHDGVVALTTEFVTRVVQDARINHYFARADGGKLIGLISGQICAALGGECVYRGRPMKEVHKNMGITTAQFNALVEDLQDAMDARSIRARHQNKLLDKLAPMWRDIVTR